jgi:demethylspheroidene O-methyltransferase
MSDKIDIKSKWVLRRNAILGDARFQAWAARTPLIRWVARRKAAKQFDLVAGFVYSQILQAFVEAGLIGHLRGRLLSVPDIAAFAKLNADSTDRLLKAGAALQLCESPQAGLWTLGQTGAELSCNEGAMAMIRHHRLLYRDLADPLGLLAQDRSDETNLSAFWTYAAKSDGDVQGYSALMAATQPMVSAQIVDAYDFSAHKRMLDIGGGLGAFVRAVSAAVPKLEFGIFDLPDVIAQADGRLGQMHPGSFKTDPIPRGYDLVTLSRILHDHDDNVAAALLTTIHAALPPGGRLLIVEPMASSPGARRMGDGYFGLYLWAMNSGRPRSAGEIGNMLQKAGFTRSKPINTALPIITSAIVATK